MQATPHQCCCCRRAYWEEQVGKAKQREEEEEARRKRAKDRWATEQLPPCYTGVLLLPSLLFSSLLNTLPLVIVLVLLNVITMHCDVEQLLQFYQWLNVQCFLFPHYFSLAPRFSSFLRHARNLSASTTWEDFTADYDREKEFKEVREMSQ
jgi:hypothetical protein